MITTPGLVLLRITAHKVIGDQTSAVHCRACDVRPEPFFRFDASVELDRNLDDSAANVCAVVVDALPDQLADPLF